MATWWPWYWIVKVKFLNGCISGTACPIGQKRKWYKLKQCWTHYMTLTFDLPMTLTLDFQGQIFQLLYFRKGLSAGHEIKGIWIDKMLDPLYDLDLESHLWLCVGCPRLLCSQPDLHNLVELMLNKLNERAVWDCVLAKIRCQLWHAYIRLWYNCWCHRQNVVWIWHKLLLRLWFCSQTKVTM